MGSSSRSTVDNEPLPLVRLDEELPALPTRLRPSLHADLKSEAELDAPSIPCGSARPCELLSERVLTVADAARRLELDPSGVVSRISASICFSNNLSFSAGEGSRPIVS